MFVYVFDCCLIRIDAESQWDNFHRGGLSTTEHQ